MEGVVGVTPLAGGAAGLAVLSRGVVLGSWSVGRGSPDAGDRPAEKLVYVFERRPCTSRLALQAYSNNVVISKYSL